MFRIYATSGAFKFPFLFSSSKRVNWFTPFILSSPVHQLVTYSSRSSWLLQFAKWFINVAIVASESVRTEPHESGPIIQRLEVLHFGRLFLPSWDSTDLQFESNFNINIK